MSQYNLTITYAPGKANQETDALSRNPILKSFEKICAIFHEDNLIFIQD